MEVRGFRRGMVVILIVGFILGSVLGSLVKALADRSLINKSFFGRSYCPNCKTTLAWYDLFPILSYLMLSGRCRYCRKKINAEYLLVEVISGLLIGILFVKFFNDLPNPIDNFRLVIYGLEDILSVFFVTVLLIVALTDLKKTLIPDRVMFPSIVASIITLIIVALLKIYYLYIYLSQTPVGRELISPYNDYFRRHALINMEPMFGALITGILISAFFILLIIVTKGKGMGGGDVKLGGFIGLGLGFPNGILAVTLGFISGAIVSILLIIVGKKHFGENIPFGPFLVLGSLISLYFGPQIISWYTALK